MALAHRMASRGPAEALALSAALVMSSTAAVADPVADFYQGKTISIHVGFSAGGGYDQHARMLAPYLAKYVPGSPHIIVKNTPGAAGLVLLNSIANTMPKDGTVIATFDRSVPLEYVLDPPKVHFTPAKMNWIGSTDSDAATCIGWHSAQAKTIQDLMKTQLIVGATGAASGEAVTFPKLLNAILGTKFKIVPGYAGATEALLAMERGETEGFCSMSFSNLEATRAEWLREGKINVLAQFALRKHPNYPDVPLALDLAKTEADRKAIEFIVAPTFFSRPFAAAEGIPEDRRRALRSAFNRAVTDPDYRAEAARRGVNVQLVTGEQIDEVVGHIFSTPDDVIERVKAAIK